ncbi:hypothetical protein BX666DRAFT_1996379 [Dichotomocladium elegans]|nr:hypothetical protein BX666DRAFT_1996379 [Dichotomocladium elegans]
MELNICLYCEKRLLDDTMPFCSSTCRASEENKVSTLTSGIDMETRLFTTTSISHRRCRRRVISATISSPNNPLTSYHHKSTPLSRVSSTSSALSDDAPLFYFACKDNKPASSMMLLLH